MANQVGSERNCTDASQQDECFALQGGYGTYPTATRERCFEPFIFLYLKGKKREEKWQAYTAEKPCSRMNDGRTMDYEALRQEAHRVVVQSGSTQTEIADELDVSAGALSRALSESGPKFSRLQCRILQHLTPYRIERQVVFTAIRRDHRSEDQESGT